MQILADAPLFTVAYFEDRVLQPFSLRDIDSCSDNILRLMPRPGQHRGGPTDQASSAAGRQPVALMVRDRSPGGELMQCRAKFLGRFRSEEHFSQAPALHVRE